MLERMALQRIAIVLAVIFAASAVVFVGPAIAGREGAQRGADCGSNGRDDDGRDDYKRRGRRGALSVIGLTADGRLICFTERNPDRATTIGQVSGLAGDTSLVGIDFRPANGALYGAGNAGGVYTLNTDTAVATKVAQLSVALAGAAFGVDVNPAADALRIVSDTGQNLRFSFAAGTTATDTALTYPPATAAATAVTGAAYTNNDADPNTGTTLFVIDAMLDQVAIQSPANSGQLVATGKLGVDAGARVAFDIYSTIRDDSTVGVRALAALTVDGQSGLYLISLLTGRAALLGTFSAQNQLIGLAIPLRQL